LVLNKFTLPGSQMAINSIQSLFGDWKNGKRKNKKGETTLKKLIKHTKKLHQPKNRFIKKYFT